MLALVLAALLDHGGQFGIVAPFGQFVELLPYERIVEDVVFASDAPAFAGTMRVTPTLTPVADGTRVTILCANVPPGISADDHQAGMAATLRNLAAFIE